MKRRNLLVFFLILVAIVAAYFVTASGFKIGKFEIKPIMNQVKLGLDIKGGVVVVYEAKSSPNMNMDEAVSQTIAMLSNRINALGLTEPNISKQGRNRIRIEIPGVANTAEAVRIIGQTAQLEFVDVEPGAIAKEGMSKEDFKHSLVLTGENVEAAGTERDPNSGSFSVTLKFDSKGTDLFAAATKKKVENEGSSGQIAIVLDGKVISAPVVRSVIPNGRGSITGNFTITDARNLALLIRSGSLPVELTEEYSSEIGPTLGLNSLNSAMKAALVGLIAVALYMAFKYKYPGIIAGVALSIYALLIMYAMVGFGATLTLPGIAGIVISLGMAVDANVIIFERIKEELANKKSVRASIRHGFSRAMSTVMDSNITTFIAALVLFMFGNGPIKGFAITLMMGIVGSMITAVFVTRSLLNLSVEVSGNPLLYGHREAK